MRIVFVSHYALPHPGGIETAVHHVAGELARRGHDVVHVTSDAGGRAASPVERDYELVQVAAWNGLEARFGVPWPVFEPVALRRALRTALADADVVHAHGFLYLGTAVAFAAARGGGRPARVLTEHVAHVDYSNPAVDAAERAAIATVGRACVRAADAAVAYNDRVARELLDLAPGVSITHIGNGVDTSRFRPAQGDERTRLRSELGWDELPRALFVGRLVAKKGVGLAVAAATELAGSCELVLVGPGRPETPLPPHVRVLGEQPPEEIARLMRAADVFLLPSRGEGFPLTAQEAMASGLPVILADDPGYRSVLDGAGDGVRLAAQEPEAVTAAVRELLESADVRATAARAAAGFAQREFSWERAADQHEHLYDDLLGERSSASAST